jgi:hypothetical protein
MPHTRTHGLVWLDSRTARILRYAGDTVDHRHVDADPPHRQVHHRAHHANASHPPDRPAYFEAIAKALEGVDDWLVVGPAETKTDFVNHVRDKGPKPLAARLLGVEAMDHPDDAALRAFGLRRFREHDRMTANSPTVGTSGRQEG